MDKVIKHEHGKYKPVDLSPNPPKPDDNWPYHNKPNSGDDVQYGIASPKFERHIFIRKDQILHDIESQVSIVAEMRKKDDGTTNDTLAEATDKFKSMFSRWIDKHISIAKGIMSAFILEKFTETAMNSIKDKEEIDITLLFPEWYDDTVFPQLCDAVHDYIVNAVLTEFFIIALTSKDSVTIDKSALADEAKHNVKVYVNASKPNRIKKIQKPFG